MLTRFRRLTSSCLKEKKGFTFIELSMVILVIGVILSLTFPFLQRLSQDPLTYTARRMAGISRELFFDTISEQIRYRLYYDIDANTYWVTKETFVSGNIVEEVKVGKEKKLPVGVEFTDISTEVHGKKSEGKVFTAFHPESEGWADYTEIRLKEGERDITLEINPANGEVKIHEGIFEKTGFHPYRSNDFHRHDFYDIGCCAGA